MTRHLTQEWLDLERELVTGLPEAPGCTARVRHVVTGGPDGDVTYLTVFEDGRITENVLGDGDGDADVVLTMPHDVAVAIATDELDPNAAYMQGRIKLPDTRSGPLLRVLARITADDYRAVRAQLAAATDV